jgi:hypothetical protein
MPAPQLRPGRQSPSAEGPRFRYRAMGGTRQFPLHSVSYGCAASLEAPLEMFHRIRNVSFPAVDSGFDESGIEQFADGTDKRFAFQVFLVTRLLTHEQDLCVRLPFSEHSLCRLFPKITSLAIFGGFFEFFKRPFRRNRCVCRTGRMAFRHAG